LANLKLGMSSLDIAAITLELESLIRGKYLDNIYQISTKTFLFRFTPGPFNLIVEAGRRIHLTKYEAKVPRKPSQFCMALRKHLRGARVAGIQQHEFERTVILDIDTAGQTRSVIAEFFGKGNLIVVDKSGKILLALSYARMRDRNIVKAEIFKYAPPSGLNPFNLTSDQLANIRQYGSIPTTKALALTLSIGGTLAKEILLRSELDDMPANKLTDENLSTLIRQFQNLRSHLTSHNLDPTINIGKNGELYDLAPVRLRSYEEYSSKRYPTFNEAADEYFTELARRTTMEESTEALLRKEQRLTRIREMQQRQLDDLRRAIEENNVKGQLIIRYLNELQQISAEVLARRKKERDVNKISYKVEKPLADRQIPIQIKSIDLNKGILCLDIERTDVRLSLSRKPQQEAANYFRAGKRAKEKMSGLLRAMEDTVAKMKIVDSERAKAEPVRILRRRERAWFEKFRWFRSSEGFLVIAGRDATTNELLIKKHTDPSDIVLHADAQGAPFVVIKADLGSPSEPTILEAAQLGVSNSRLWMQKVASGDAFWVRPDQVSKKAPSGQYLSRGSFMIGGKRNYVKGVELRLAVGIQVNGESVRIIGGPPDAIRTHSAVHVEIVPGVTAHQKLARQVLFELSRMFHTEPKPRLLTVDQVIEFLPPGTSDLARPS